MNNVDKELKENFARKQTENKKQREFIIKALESGVSRREIKTLFANITEYKSLLRNKNILINDILKEKEKEGSTVLKTFEFINDETTKIIIENKAKKLLKSVTSNKYKNLIDNDTIKIFKGLISNDVSREDLEKGVLKKINIFKTSQEFNKALVEKYLNTYTKETVLEKVKETNAELLLEKEGVFYYKVPDFETMNKIGTDMWCVQREKRMFEEYRDSLDDFVVSFDTNISMNNKKALTASIVSPSGKVIEIYDNNDDLILVDSIKKDIEDSFTPKTYDLLKNEHTQKLKNNEKVNSFLSVCLLGGLFKEYKNNIDKDSLENLEEYHIIEIIENNMYEDRGINLNCVDELSEKGKEDLIKNMITGLRNSYISTRKLEKVFNILEKESLQKNINLVLEKESENKDENLRRYSSLMRSAFNIRERRLSINGDKEKIISKFDSIFKNLTDKEKVFSILNNEESNDSDMREKRIVARLIERNKKEVEDYIKETNAVQSLLNIEDTLKLASNCLPKEEFSNKVKYVCLSKVSSVFDKYNEYYEKNMDHLNMIVDVLKEKDCSFILSMQEFSRTVLDVSSYIENKKEKDILNKINNMLRTHDYKTDSSEIKEIKKSNFKSRYQAHVKMKSSENEPVFDDKMLIENLEKHFDKKFLSEFREFLKEEIKISQENDSHNSRINREVYRKTIKEIDSKENKLKLK